MSVTFLRTLSMRNYKIVCLSLAAVLILASAPALAQVYSWKDPATGQSKFSNIAPPWYSRGENVRGPRVVATVGEKVIDDTSLPFDRRLLLSGKSQAAVDKLRLQAYPEPVAVPQPYGEPPGPKAGGRRSGDKSAAGGATPGNNGS